MSINIAIFGCKNTTIFLIEALQEKIKIDLVITIPPAIAEKNEVADYVDLVDACEKREITVYQAQSYHLLNEQDQLAISSHNIDIAFVSGWQRLLPEAVLKSFSIGAFGMHGSAQNLPIGRGRSPMNWSIIEGRTHFFTNLFRYDAGVDSGDILATQIFSIQPSDTAETLHFKNTLAMSQLILKNLDNLTNNNFSLTQQPDKQPTYYPKRSPADSLIDWRQDIHFLHRFIRAVAPPFNGAFSFIGDKKISILRAEIFETDLTHHGFEETIAGTILTVFPNGKFLLRVVGGLLIVHEYEASYELATGQQFTSDPQQIKQFRLNEIGGYDFPEGI